MEEVFYGYDTKLCHISILLLSLFTILLFLSTILIIKSIIFQYLILCVYIYINNVYTRITYITCLICHN